MLSISNSQKRALDFPQTSEEPRHTAAPVVEKTTKIAHSRLTLAQSSQALQSLKASRISPDPTSLSPISPFDDESPFSPEDSPSSPITRRIETIPFSSESTLPAHIQFFQKIQELKKVKPASELTSALDDLIKNSYVSESIKQIPRDTFRLSKLRFVEDCLYAVIDLYDKANADCPENVDDLREDLLIEQKATSKTRRICPESLLYRITECDTTRTIKIESLKKIINEFHLLIADRPEIEQNALYSELETHLFKRVLLLYNKILIRFFDSALPAFKQKHKGDSKSRIDIMIQLIEAKQNRPLRSLLSRTTVPTVPREPTIAIAPLAPDETSKSAKIMRNIYKLIPHIRNDIKLLQRAQIDEVKDSIHKLIDLIAQIDIHEMCEQDHAFMRNIKRFFNIFIFQIDSPNDLQSLTNLNAEIRNYVRTYNPGESLTPQLEKLVETLGSLSSRKKIRTK